MCYVGRRAVLCQQPSSVHVLLHMLQLSVWSENYRSGSFETNSLNIPLPNNLKHKASKQCYRLLQKVRQAIRSSIYIRLGTESTLLQHSCYRWQHEQLRELFLLWAPKFILKCTKWKIVIHKIIKGAKILWSIRLLIPRICQSWQINWLQTTLFVKFNILQTVLKMDIDGTVTFIFISTF